MKEGRATDSLGVREVQGTNGEKGEINLSRQEAYWN